MRDLLQTWWERLIKFVAIYFIRPLQIYIVRHSIHHIHGPQSIEYGPDELIVLCLMRDAELYIHAFMHHYDRLGVRHIVLLDNGSTDRTTSLAKQYKNVTVLQCKRPFKRYKMAMRHYLIRRFVPRDRWALYVDIDELFDYPYSDRLDLADFLRYLRERRYTAVIAYMLDMFSERPLNERQDNAYDDLTTQHRFYDLTNIIKMDYYFPRNQLPNNDVKAYFGGIRRTLFAPEDIRFVLTKHPLFLIDGRTKPLVVDEHYVRDAHIADVTCVLFHYKFLGDFAERTRRAVREENYHTASIDYKKYLQVLGKRPNLIIKQETAQEFKHINELLEANFLQASARYINWVKNRQ